MRAQTRRGSFGNLFAKVGSIVALALTFGFGGIGDEAGSLAGSGRGPASGAPRAMERTETVDQMKATKTSRYGEGGGTLATRR